MHENIKVKNINPHFPLLTRSKLNIQPETKRVNWKIMMMRIQRRPF
jgi:hypothetical protein